MTMRKKRLSSIVSKELRTESYDYRLPTELIATEPAEPRDSARLLIVDRKSGEITHTIFSDIFSFLPKESAIIYNNTKVIKARIFGIKESGGKVELLLNRPFKEGFLVYIKGKVRNYNS